LDAPGTGGSAAASGGDDREAILQGLGATVLRGEIKGYKILQVVGEGSMGTVYRAHQISMDRIVALKVLTQTKNQAFVEQFLTEARNAGRLNHPNLIRVHEVGRSGTLYYYSMEYVDGLTLGELMDEFEGGRLDPKRAVNIFLQIAAALDHGYRMNIIHREIRPKSIMITEGDQAKLDGLGLTKDETTRFLMGENAHYVAPEQAKGQQPDTRSDMYCLGCCLFHALTGEPPFTGGGPKEILGRRIIVEPPDPRQVNPAIPDELAVICMKMMARDNKARYQTPAELVDALKKVNLVPPAAGRPGTKGKLPTGTGGRVVRSRMAARRRHRFRR
jgi:serine/threonine protein kinase